MPERLLERQAGERSGGARSMQIMGYRNTFQDRSWLPSGVGQRYEDLGAEGKFWVLEFDDLANPMYIGRPSPVSPGTRRQRPVDADSTRRLSARQASRQLSRVNLDGVQGTEDAADMKLLICTAGSGPDGVAFQYFVRGMRSSTGRITLSVDKLTAEDIVAGLESSRLTGESIGLSYDASLRIEVVADLTLDGRPVLGKLRFGSERDRRVLYLDTAPGKGGSVLRGTAAHEHFHHMQAVTSQGAGGGMVPFGGVPQSRLFMIEGLADWWADVIHDDDDPYMDTLGALPEQGILENGLEFSRFQDEEYHAMFFWKYLDKTCNNFRPSLEKLFTSDFSGNGPVKVLDSFLPVARCDFGDHLGSEASSTLESALMYYSLLTTRHGVADAVDLESNEGFWVGTDRSFLAVGLVVRPVSFDTLLLPARPRRLSSSPSASI